MSIQSKSIQKMRLGMAIILIIWMPPYDIICTPIIARFLSSDIKHELELYPLIFIMFTTLQTIFGIIGFYMVGGSTAKIIKSNKKRDVIPILWSIVIKGKIPINKYDLR